MSSPMFIRAAIARSQMATATRSQAGSMLSRNHAFRIPAQSLSQDSKSSFSTTAIRSAAGSETRLSSTDRTILATTRAIRNILLFSTSSLAIGYFVWSGTHAYLEQYKCPSPAGVSSQTRNCLHGAWVREEISPDPDVAEIYFNKAIEMTRKELVDLYAKKEKAQDSSSSTRREYEIERDAALVEIQSRLARFYARIGQDERAATIWTRLWKLSDKSTPQEAERASKGSATFSLGALFGGSSERPLVTRQDGAQFAKSAADCWMRMGEYEMAEEALGWILSSRSSEAPAAGSTVSIEEIGLWSTLGALYVRQKKFDYALSLFVKALQSVQAKRNTLTEVSEDKDMWFCREAILMNSIGETLLGAANAVASLPAAQPKQEDSKPKSESSWKFWSSSSSSSSSSGSTTTTKASKSAELTKKEEEALGWMQKAIAMAKEKSGKHRDCDECAGLALNTLGLVYEMEGDKDVALAQFKEALVHATLAKDYVGVDDYNKNIARLTEVPASSSEPTAE
ncbi:hypothetical protein BG005_002638 [Podila minutissima]|nr:hypothetical protein BG005_002638 [Podila minutissima]